jgi:hypothetical protein
MDRGECLQLLKSFFRRDPPFSSREQWDAPAGEETDTWELYENYFTSRSENDKRMIAEIMASVALGHEIGYEEYLGPTMVLMTMLCALGFADYFRHVQEELEAEFADTENIRTWQSVSDDETLFPGSEFKRNWHYGLQLSNILRFMGSNRADTTRQMLLSSAVSQRFRAALLRS